MAISRMAVALVLVLCCAFSCAAHGKGQVVQERTSFTPQFELGPGDVSNNYNVMEEFPKGHIAIRGITAELVDENGVSVPLTEVYLHHVRMMRYWVKKGHNQLASSVPRTPEVGMRKADIERIAFQEGANPLSTRTHEETLWSGCIAKFDGFPLGAETRHTNATLPAPYGWVAGDPDAIPEGYEEIWVVNTHGINTIDVVDMFKCIECVCDSYGATQDSAGNPLPEGYVGGLLCCGEKAHCAVKESAQTEKKKYSLKYMVAWVDFDESVVPVRSYDYDASDPRKSLDEEPICEEFDVPQCAPGSASNKCTQHYQAVGAIPVGGDIISCRLHQHPGGLGGVISYDDGTVLCAAEPIYGRGTEAGDEAGHVVGITDWFPEPGTIKAESMRQMRYDAYYSNERMHTGCMSTFTVNVADPVTRIKEVTDRTTN